MSWVAKNRRIYDQTTAVRDALARLELAGCRVVDVRLGGRQPVIFIDADDGAENLEGAVYMRERIHGRTVATYVCPLMGCQVRWPAVVPEPTPDNVLRFNGAGVAA